jgi:hypothetical protein
MRRGVQLQPAHSALSGQLSVVYFAARALKGAAGEHAVLGPVIAARRELGIYPLRETQIYKSSRQVGGLSQLWGRRDVALQELSEVMCVHGQMEVAVRELGQPVADVHLGGQADDGAADLEIHRFLLHIKTKGTRHVKLRDLLHKQPCHDVYTCIVLNTSPASIVLSDPNTSNSSRWP